MSGSVPITTSGRRSSSLLDAPLGSFKGPNSLSKFASSYQRASHFHDIDTRIHNERSYLTSDNEEIIDPVDMAPTMQGRRLSQVVGETRPLLNDLEPQLSNTSSLLKQVENAQGETVTVLAGQSTAPQTIFNAVNVLMGIGLLALPLGVMRAGWIFGLLILTLCSTSTFYSAQLLSKCIDVDPTLMTYADLGYAAFGARGRALISFMFSLDLLGAGVSMIVLFADTLHALVPAKSVLFWKFVVFFAITPQNFMPLSLLSNVSLISIICTCGTVVAIAGGGFFKPEIPGSLLHPMPTSWLPGSMLDLCVSLGILMAPFGGHAVFPNLKADMRHPQKFSKCLVSTYSVVYLTNLFMAVVGFLMFGMTVKDEVSKSILLTPGFPKFVYAWITFAMAFIPLAKTPLIARPLISIFDDLFGLRQESFNFWTSVSKGGVRVGVNILLLVVAILLPDFDRIIALLGAGICFIICLVLPCLFYMIICKDKVPAWERVFCWFIIVVSLILSVAGTYAALVV